MKERGNEWRREREEKIKKKVNKGKKE